MPPRAARFPSPTCCPSCLLPIRVFHPQSSSSKRLQRVPFTIRPFTIRTTPTATSTTTSPSSTTTTLEPTTSLSIPESTHILHDPTASTPSATFTTLGANSNLLSISLSASQPLHTRRGTLLSFSGPAHHTTSSLSPLQPFRRGALGLPFLFQRLTATSPINLLLSSPSSGSFLVLSLDGRIDWRIFRPQSLVAWSGSRSSLSISSHFSTSTPGVANWIQQTVTGRGLVALTARGGAFEVRLKEGEEYLAHPSHVVAYSISSNAPSPYRLSHTRLRLAIPSLGEYLPETQFIKAVRESRTFLFLGRVLFRLRQWLRVAMWGERVFLRLRGPGTVVVQGRPGGVVSGVRDSMDEREVREWVDSPAGTLQKSLSEAERRGRREEDRGVVEKKGGVKQEEHVTYATIGKDGKVAWTRD
ncbi:MAG: hypothetical protein Q9162_004408 [Coniocarpon cinnabarinum]